METTDYDDPIANEGATLYFRSWLDISDTIEDIIRGLWVVLSL